jgi:hypothetical protein
MAPKPPVDDALTDAVYEAQKLIAAAALRATGRRFKRIEIWREGKTPMAMRYNLTCETEAEIAAETIAKAADTSIAGSLARIATALEQLPSKL